MTTKPSLSPSPRRWREEQSGRDAVTTQADAWDAEVEGYSLRCEHYFAETFLNLESLGVACVKCRLPWDVFASTLELAR